MSHPLCALPQEVYIHLQYHSNKHTSNIFWLYCTTRSSSSNLWRILTLSVFHSEYSLWLMVTVVRIICDVPHTVHTSVSPPHHQKQRHRCTQWGRCDVPLGSAWTSKRFRIPTYVTVVSQSHHICSYIHNHTHAHLEYIYVRTSI